MVATDELMLETGLAGRSDRRRGTSVASAASVMDPFAAECLSAENWSLSNIEQACDNAWQTGPAGFGTLDPGVSPRTRWTTDNIWLRRRFIMLTGHYPHLVVYCYHDEDVQVYINGVLAASAPGYSTSYVPLHMTPAGKKALHPGRNLMAVHVLQTTGGQFFDAGLAQR